MAHKNVFIEASIPAAVVRSVRRTLAEGKLCRTDRRVLSGLGDYRILIASGAGQGLGEPVVRTLAGCAGAHGPAVVVEHRRDRAVLLIGAAAPLEELTGALEGDLVFLSASPVHRSPRLLPLAHTQARHAGFRRFLGPGRLFSFQPEELTPADQEEMDASLGRLQTLMRGGTEADLEALARSSLVVLSRQARAARKLAYYFSSLRARFLDPYPEAVETDPVLRRAKALVLRPESVGNLGELAAGLAGYLVRLGVRLGSRDGRSLMEQAMEFTRNSSDPGLSMAVVANHFSMNYSRFSQRFKAAAGMGFNDYLRKVKIDKSIELLKESPLKVYEIARRAGYQSTKHFMKVFKEQTGLSPTGFRQASL